MSQADFNRAGGFAALLLALAIPAASPLAQSGAPCASCISLRLGPALVVRGPAGNESDAPFSATRLPSGGFRGFTSNHTTYAIDGQALIAMGGEKRAVLPPGSKGSASDCGRWITTVIRDRDRLIGLVHNETRCKYRAGETHKSMSIAFSRDEGLSWDDRGLIIAGTDAPAKGRDSGEGDCTMVDGADGHLYAYCLRIGDWRVFVARAPKSDPLPGRWMKWDGRGWNAPALGGEAAALPRFPGMGAARLRDAGLFLLVAADKSLKLSVARDNVDFTQVSEPLILYDADEWKRPAATELLAYPSMLGESGSNEIGAKFLLTYVYVPPRADFTQRYLVMHEAEIVIGRDPISPQVRLALARYSLSGGGSWTTSGPPVDAAGGVPPRLDRALGDIMTAPPVRPNVKIEECTALRAGKREHFLSDRLCEADGGERRRSAGWIYRERKPGTLPLVACAAPDGSRFVSNDEACESRGRPARRLGYILARQP